MAGSKRIPQKGDLRFYETTQMQYKLKALERRVEELENGTAYQKEVKRGDQWRERYEAQVKETERVRKEGDKKLAAAERDVRRWQDVAEDVEGEKEAIEAACNKKIAAAEAKAEKRKETNRKIVAEHKKERARLRDQTLELKQALGAIAGRMSRTHESSNIPSSHDRLPGEIAFVKNIEELCAESLQEEEETRAPKANKKKKRHNRNSRVKSGLKAGGQLGHEHYPRKDTVPTDSIIMHDEVPEALKGPRTYKTNRIKRKKVIQLHLVARCEEHIYPVWRNPDTCREGTLPIPMELKDEVNYGATVRAMVLMLRHCGNVSIDKVRKFIREATGGVVDVSHGWVNKQLKMFSKAAQPEVMAIFDELFESKWMHVDSTVARCDKRREAISIACNATAVFFSHTKNKGKKALAALPCAPALGYDGDVVSDREVVFIILGNDHQDCLAHYFRELLEVSRMEPDKTWAQDVADLLVEMMRASSEWLAVAKETGQDPIGPSAEQAEKWRQGLLDALAKGDAQYKAKPPTKYFLEGHTLCHVLKERIENVLLFTKKPWIPNTNNAVERQCKVFKRAQHQAVTFRDSKYLDYLSDFLTVTATQELRDESIYSKLLEIMSRIGYLSKESA